MLIFTSFDGIRRIRAFKQFSTEIIPLYLQHQAEVEAFHQAVTHGIPENFQDFMLSQKLRAFNLLNKQFPNAIFRLIKLISLHEEVNLGIKVFSNFYDENKIHEFDNDDLGITFKKYQKLILTCNQIMNQPVYSEINKLVNSEKVNMILKIAKHPILYLFSFWF